MLRWIRRALLAASAAGLCFALYELRQVSSMAGGLAKGQVSEEDLRELAARDKTGALSKLLAEGEAQVRRLEAAGSIEEAPTDGGAASGARPPVRDARPQEAPEPPSGSVSLRDTNTNGSASKRRGRGPAAMPGIRIIGKKPSSAAQLGRYAREKAGGLAGSAALSDDLEWRKRRAYAMLLGIAALAIAAVIAARRRWVD